MHACVPLLSYSHRQVRAHKLLCASRHARMPALGARRQHYANISSFFHIAACSLHAAANGAAGSNPLSAYVSIRQHTSAYVSMQLLAGPLRQYLYVCTRKASAFGRKSRSMHISALTLSTSACGVCGVCVCVSVRVWNCSCR